MMERSAACAFFVADIGEDTITLQLTMGGAWTVKGGLCADVNSATVPAWLIDGLGGSLNGVVGRIEFWGTQEPGGGTEEEPATVLTQNAPLLRQVQYPDGRADKPHIVLLVAVQEEASNAYVNRTIRLDAESVESGDGVLTFKQRLGKVSGDERADFDPFFVAIAENQLKPTFSCEARSNADNRKLFGCYGFAAGETSVSALSESASRGRLTGYRPGTAVHYCSEIREVRFNGTAASDGKLIVFVNGGGGVPFPTQKYQVYQPIDDTLSPIWTSLRVGP